MGYAATPGWVQVGRATQHGSPVMKCLDAPDPLSLLQQPAQLVVGGETDARTRRPTDRRCWASDTLALLERQRQLCLATAVARPVACQQLMGSSTHS